jgi:hypothetical protein
MASNTVIEPTADEADDRAQRRLTLRRLLRVLKRMVRWDDRCRAGRVAFGVRDYKVDALVDRARDLLEGKQ